MSDDFSEMAIPAIAAAAAQAYVIHAEGNEQDNPASAAYRPPFPVPEDIYKTADYCS